MKTFIVNKNSWHYKLNVKICQTNERLNEGNNAELYVQSRDTICSYWQTTIWSIIKVVFIIGFLGTITFSIGALLYMYGYAMLFHTTETLILSSIVLGVIGFAIAIVAFFAWLETRKRRELHEVLHEGRTSSMTKAKYDSWKNGICLPVEFKS